MSNFVIKKEKTAYQKVYEKIVKDLSDAIELSKKDKETAHSKADETLCKFLRFLGYNEIVDLFDKLEKWYS